MGGLEVAYELQGTANYTLTSQGEAFVGSWPYDQILIGLLTKIERLIAAETDTRKENNGGPAIGKKDSPARIINELVKEIWSFCYLSSYDFQLAGYSFDLSLCDLSKVHEIETPLKELSSALIKGLSDPVLRKRILLAHWDAQS